MCRGTTFRAWQAAALRALFSIDGVEPAVLIIDASHGPARRRRSRFAWNLYHNRWVARRSSALAPVELSEELGNLPVVRAVVERQGWSEFFAEDDLVAIRDLDVDVLVRFAFGILRGDVLAVARYGIWSYHHGDERLYRGGPPCYWELVDRSATVGAILQRLTDRLDAGIVLHRGTFATTPHSYTRTRDTALLGSAPWLARTARAILAGTIDPHALQAATSEAPIRRDPHNRRMLSFLATQTGRKVAHTARELFRHQRWEVGVIDLPAHRLLAGAVPAVRWIRPRVTRSEYLADPFPDGSGALVEHYDYRQGSGEIQRLEPTADGWRLERVRLPVSGHASYPSMATAGGSVYLAPQLTDHAGVRLFRREGHRWDDLGTIIQDVDARDPTLISWQGSWYLFFTDARQGANSHLYCWIATAPAGPWTPHVLNPVKTDVTSARPAGTPFVHENTLYRPAQDCSTHYGAALVLNRVDTLDATSFEETPLRRIGPLDTAHAAGAHTLSTDGITTWVDGCRERFIGAAFRRELAARVRRVRR